MYFPSFPTTVKDDILVDVIKKVLFEQKNAKIDEVAKAILYELEQKVYEIYKRV